MQITGYINDRVNKIAVYESQSNGKCILLLHGNSESAEIFKNQFESSLSDTFHLAAIDLPGHGGSSPAKKPALIYNLPYLKNVVV